MSKEALIGLINNVDEKEYDVLYRVLLKFVKEVPPMQDEIDAIKLGEKELDNGKVISLKEVNWN